MTKRSAVETRQVGLSYKYQRLRERLRNAVETGQLTGKLPGERELSKRYGANPKTINKALTDLATEGLLVRHVGRGTFVANDNPTGPKDDSARRLAFGYLAPAGELRAYAEELFRRAAAILKPLGHTLGHMNVSLDASGELSGRRLTADRLRAFDGLALFGFRPSAALLASTSREHVPLVLVNNQHAQVRTAAVLVDYAQGAFELSQQLIYLGHKDVLLCVDQTLMPAAGTAEIGYRAAMQRIGLKPRPVYCVQDPSNAQSALTAIDNCRPTGVICAGSQLAVAIAGDTSARSDPPLSLCCITEPCDAAAAKQGITAYETDPDQLARWLVELLVSASPTRWQRVVIVPGAVVDRGSVLPAAPPARTTRTPGVAEL